MQKGMRKMENFKEILEKAVADSNAEAAVLDISQCGSQIKVRFFELKNVEGQMFANLEVLSPKKTWEGLLGGLVLAIIASVTVFEYLRPRISSIGFEFSDALVLGIILGILGVIGDLSESLIKREIQVKDSGEVLPGIGGALDLIDSLLFTAPAMYLYLILFVRG